MYSIHKIPQESNAATFFTKIYAAANKIFRREAKENDLHALIKGAHAETSLSAEDAYLHTCTLRFYEALK